MRSPGRAPRCAWLLVAAVLVGCSSGADPSTSGDGDSPSGDADVPVATGGDVPCDAWRVLTADTTASADDLSRAVEELRAWAGEDELLDDVADAVDVIAEIVPDGSLADLDPSELSRVDLERILVAAGALDPLLASNRISLAAADGCEGAADPRFVLPCSAATFEAVGPSLGLSGPDDSMEPGSPPPIDDEVSDLVAAAGGDVVRGVHRPLDDGGHEVALLDADDVAVVVYELQANDGEWWRHRTSDCDGAGVVG